MEVEWSAWDGRRRENRMKKAGLYPGGGSAEPPPLQINDIHDN